MALRSLGRFQEFYIWFMERNKRDSRGSMERNHDHDLGRRDSVRRMAVRSLGRNQERRLDSLGGYEVGGLDYMERTHIRSV